MRTPRLAMLAHSTGIADAVEPDLRRNAGGRLGHAKFVLNLVR